MCYIDIDSTPVNDFKFRDRSQKHAQELVEFIEKSLDNANSHSVSLFPIYS